MRIDLCFLHTNVHVKKWDENWHIFYARPLRGANCCIFEMLLIIIINVHVSSKCAHMTISKFHLIPCLL